MYTKKFYWAILSLLLSFLALSFATSCTDDIEKKDNGPILVESILLNAESVTLNISEKYKLSATITPEDATDKTLQWRSENPAIASVSDEGEIVAVAGGSTRINAIANGGAFAACSVIVNAPEPEPEPETEKPLKGRIIGTEMSVDYSLSGFPASTTANTKAMAFDGNFDTFFGSYDRSGTWVGMDLQTKYVITKIGYAPRQAHSSRVQLAVIEGANKSDFSDAMPIHIIKESAPEGKMTYAEVECSRGFRYVRYVTPNDVRCNIAELEFYGTKGEGDDTKLYQATNLPMVVINTEGAQDIVSKENEITSTVYIISENGTSLLTDTQTGVRGRGNASWTFPKKPYRLKFSSKCSPLDAPAKAKKWTLINNYGDKTLMRNLLAFELSRRVGLSYTPFSHPVDVILNGEYKGCYQLCDQIEVNKNRVAVTEMEDNDNSENISGGYLIEIDAYAWGEDYWFTSNKGIPVTIKSPEEGEAQKSYIRNHFNQMEAAVFASNFTDKENGYRKYLDLESFLKHFIVGELAGNTDTYWSVYMYKERDNDKLFTGPIWDHDLSFENDNRTYPINDKTDFIYTHWFSSAAHEEVRNMVNRIIKEDVATHDQLVEMWNELRSTTLTENALVQYINDTAALIDESQELNFKRWDILNSMVHQNYQALGSYDAEVDVVRSYIKARLMKMDELIGTK